MAFYEKNIAIKMKYENYLALGRVFSQIGLTRRIESGVSSPRDLENFVYFDPRNKRSDLVMTYLRFPGASSGDSHYMVGVRFLSRNKRQMNSLLSRIPNHKERRVA